MLLSTAPNCCSTSQKAFPYSFRGVTQPSVLLEKAEFAITEEQAKE